MEKLTQIVVAVLASIPIILVKAIQREASSVQRVVQKALPDSHLSDDVSKFSSKTSDSFNGISTYLARVTGRNYPSIERLFEGFEPVEADQAIVYSALEEFPESRKPLDIDLRPWDLPPQDQGQEGSCTAFATVGVLEILLSQNGNLYKLSESDFWKSYKTPRIKAAINKIKSKSYPGIYAKNVFGEATYRVKLPEGYEPQYLSRVSEFVVMLENRKPFVIGIPVTEAVEKPSPSGWISPHKTKVYGGHAVAVVGYHIDEKNRSNSYFILRNSWGDDWGDKGYGYLPFDFCSVHSCYGYVIEKVSVKPSRY